MADWTAYKAALATKIAAVSGIVEGTSTELQGVSDVPCVKVTHVESVEQTNRAAMQRWRTATIKGVLLVGQPGDIGDAVTLVEGLCESIGDALEANVELGASGTVTDSYLDSWVFGPQRFAEADWVGADLTFKVDVKEYVGAIRTV